MKSLAGILAMGAALCGASLLPVHAMPLSNLAATSHDAIAGIESVGYVCRRHRCWSQPDYYAPVVVAPPVYYYGYDGCAPGQVGCGPHLYGGFYRPYRWWGYPRRLWWTNDVL